MEDEPAPELVPGLDEDEFSDDPIPDFVPGVVEEKTDFTYPTYTPRRNLLMTRSSLPAKYDGRKESYLTPEKNQGSTGLCRVFGGIEALQSVRVFVPDANCRVSVDCIPDFSYYSAGQSGKYNFEGYSAFTSRGTVSLTYPGWYTIDLTTPVLLEAKKDFAVVICVENLNGGTARIGHDISSPLTDSVSFSATDAQFSSNGISRVISR